MSLDAKRFLVAVVVFILVDLAAPERPPRGRSTDPGGHWTTAQGRQHHPVCS